MNIVASNSFLVHDSSFCCVVGDGGNMLLVTSVPMQVGSGEICLVIIVFSGVLQIIDC